MLEVEARLGCVELVETDDGIRLRTWTDGQPTELPPVLLVHGGPGMWDYLEPVARMLESHTVVHRYDQRGCGGSDPSDDHTVARYVADIDALRRHWRHDAWVVMGHSFGATLAFAYAVAHPRHTAALGYLNGTGVGDWRTPYRHERQRRMTIAQQERLAELTDSSSRSDTEELEFRTLSWFTDYADPDRGWSLAARDARLDLPINFVANRMLNLETVSRTAADVLTQARNLRMPCWFIHASGDPRPFTTVEDLASATPGGGTHLIEQAGHQPWHENPDALRNLLQRLVASLH